LAASRKLIEILAMMIGLPDRESNPRPPEYEGEVLSTETLLSLYSMYELSLKPLCITGCKI
jgi:hypothetical protein